MYVTFLSSNGIEDGDFVKYSSQFLFAETLTCGKLKDST